MNNAEESIVALIFIGWLNMWFIPLFCLLSGIGLVAALAQEKTYELPVTWMDDSIQITIHGLFRVDEKTKEGWIGEDEEQHKILITYANTSKERRHLL